MGGSSREQSPSSLSAVGHQRLTPSRLRVSIPVQRELVEGINVKTEDGVVVGKSKAAAKSAVSQVHRKWPFMPLPEPPTPAPSSS